MRKIVFMVVFILFALHSFIFCESNNKNNVNVSWENDNNKTNYFLLTFKELFEQDEWKDSSYEDKTSDMINNNQIINKCVVTLINCNIQDILMFPVPQYSKLSPPVELILFPNKKHLSWFKYNPSYDLSMVKYSVLLYSSIATDLNNDYMSDLIKFPYDYLLDEEVKINFKELLGEFHSSYSEFVRLYGESKKIEALLYLQDAVKSYFVYPSNYNLQLSAREIDLIRKGRNEDFFYYCRQPPGKRITDCDIANTIFLLLAKSFRIPSRLAIGIYLEEGDNTLTNLHGWSQCFVNGTWHTFDATPPGFNDADTPDEESKNGVADKTNANGKKTIIIDPYILIRESFINIFPLIDKLDNLSLNDLDALNKLLEDLL